MKKKTKTRYVSEFDNFKKVAELKKKRSPNTILFCTEDDWLIEVVEYKTKSGVISDNYMITEAELDNYIQFCGKDGFTDLTKF